MPLLPPAGSPALLLTPALLWTSEPASQLARGWPWLLYLGAVATAGAYAIYTVGLRRVPASVAGVTTLLEPLTATVLGVALFGKSQIWKRLPDNALPPNEVPPNVAQYMPANARAQGGSSIPHQAQQTPPRPMGQQPAMQQQNPGYQQPQQRRFQ